MTPQRRAAPKQTLAQGLRSQPAMSLAHLATTPAAPGVASTTADGRSTTAEYGRVEYGVLPVDVAISTR
jgi:hypothetical protein